MAHKKRFSTRGPRAELLDARALFQEAIRAETLRTAWTRVWRNGGAAGGDGVTVERFAARAVLELARLRADLASGEYRPGPLREVEIPKRSGGMRVLRIPCVRDRVAQTAVAQVLTPHFEQEFEEASFGYRPGRGVHHAVAAVTDARRAGFNWIVDADIRSYFDSVPHDLLMERWRESVSKGPLTELVELWLTHWFPGGRGLAQGSPLSPLLANLYLDRLDERLSTRRMRLVRYADDFVILCRSQGDAQAALERVRKALAEYGLELNPAKTRVVTFSQGLRFLGHLFVNSLVMKSKQDDAPAELRLAERWMRRIAQADAEAEAERLAAEAEEARQRAAGYAPGIRTLYLLHEGRRLSVRDNAFTVEEALIEPGDEAEWRELIAIPADMVDRIEIGPRCTLEPGARQLALATETPVAFVNGQGETLGWLAPDVPPFAARHLAQARMILDDAARLDLARRFVEARARNQRALLRRLYRGQKISSATAEALTRLGRIIRRIPHAEDMQELLGLEGRATALYWPVLGRRLSAGFRFRKRQRPAKDAANIMLNLLAGLLERDVRVAIQRAGLHPGLGALHASGNGREACVYDLMEEFRAPLAESVMVWCVNRGVIRHEMFTPLEDGSVRMTSLAWQALVRAYEARAARLIRAPGNGKRMSWKRLMLEQARALAAHVEGRGEYQPYVMDY